MLEVTTPDVLTPLRWQAQHHLHLSSLSEQNETAVVSSRLLLEPLPPALAMH